MKKLLSSFQVFHFILFVALCIFAFSVPPFQKSDEPVHFFRAMTVSMGQFQCKSNEIGKYEFVLPRAVYDFPTMLSSGDVIMQKNNKFAIGLLKKLYPYRNIANEITHEFIYCNLPAISYIPQAFAEIVLRPFNNLLLTFYGMRVMSFLIFYIFFLFSFRLIPNKYKPLLMVFALLPMILHQVTAISYDAISISISMLSTSIFILLLEKKNRAWSLWIVLMISVVVLNSAKPGYYFTYVLPFIVFPFQLSAFKKIFIILLSLIVGIWVINTSVPLLSYLKLFFENTQKWLVLYNPQYFISVLVNSFVEDGQYYLKGMFGIFGWLDYELPFVYYLFISSVLGIVLYELGKIVKVPLNIYKLCFLSLLIIGNIMLIFFHFYVAATPIGYYKVIGIQGRYFLPILPLAFFLIIQWISYLKRRPTITVTIFGVVMLIALGLSIYDRYYNYSEFFANPKALEYDLQNEILNPTRLSPILIRSTAENIYHVDKGKKISGFQMLIENQKTINVLYKFILKDGNCSVTIRTGYFDHIIGIPLAHLKQDGELPYTQPLPITPINSDTVCLSIAPVRTENNSIYMSALGENGKPIVRFLYVRQ